MMYLLTTNNNNNDDDAQGEEMDGIWSQYLQYTSHKSGYLTVNHQEKSSGECWKRSTRSICIFK